MPLRAGPSVAGTALDPPHYMEVGEKKNDLGFYMSARCSARWWLYSVHRLVLGPGRPGCGW